MVEMYRDGLSAAGIIHYYLAARTEKCLDLSPNIKDWHCSEWLVLRRDGSCQSFPNPDGQAAGTAQDIEQTANAHTELKNLAGSPGYRCLCVQWTQY